jgi:hypothetical protein
MNRLGFKHYLNVLAAIAGFSLKLHLRRRRTWLMAALILLPTALPPVVQAIDPPPADARLPIFIAMADFMYLFTLVPLTALFFACSLLSEEIEGRTFPLLLSRPAPRSAIVIGKYLSYAVVSLLLVGGSFLTAYLSFGFVLGLPIDRQTFAYVIQYLLRLALALPAYGAFCLAVSTLTKRPVVVSALFLFGWEKAVVALPGYADFLTLQKYVLELRPAVDFRRIEIDKVELPAELMRTVYPVGPAESVTVLICATIALLALACLVVRSSQYAAAPEAA